MERLASSQTTPPLRTRLLRGLAVLIGSYLAVVLTFLISLRALSSSPPERSGEFSERDATLFFGLFVGGPALLGGFVVSAVILVVAVRRPALSVGKVSAIAVLSGLVVATATFVSLLWN